MISKIGFNTYKNTNYNQSFKKRTPIDPQNMEDLAKLDLELRETALKLAQKYGFTPPQVETPPAKFVSEVKTKAPSSSYPPSDPTMFEPG